MKRLPMEILREAIPQGKEVRPETGEHSVDVLHNLALLRQNGELPKTPKFPVLLQAFRDAIKELRREKVQSTQTWGILFASAQVLLAENSWKEEVLTSIRQHLSAEPQAV